MFNISETLGFDNKLGDEVNAMLEEPSIYRIYCEYDGTEFELEFKALDVSFSDSAEIPSHPIDINSTINDNIIFTDFKISMNVVVEYEKLVETLEILKIGNMTEKGFTIETISNFEINMFWDSRSYSETSDSVGDVILSLSFVKVRFVEPKTGYLEYKKVPKPPDASEAKQGNVNVKSDTDPKKARMQEARNKSLAKEAKDNFSKYGAKNGAMKTLGLG